MAGAPPPAPPPVGPPPVAPPPVPSPVISHFNKLEYHNFLKLGKAVKCTAEGLTEFADDVVKHFHISLLHQHGSAVCTSPGSQKRITFDRRSNSWSINCPCAVCGPWTRSIGAEQATRQICWQNTSVDDWPVDAWQLAKPFMSEGKATSCNSPTDTDPAGILQLLINCKKYGPLLDIQKVKAVSHLLFPYSFSLHFTVKFHFTYGVSVCVMIMLGIIDHHTDNHTIYLLTIFNRVIVENC